MKHHRKKYEQPEPKPGEIYQQLHKRSGLPNRVMVISLEEQGSLKIVRLINVVTKRFSSTVVDRFTTRPVKYLRVNDEQKEMK